MLSPFSPSLHQVDETDTHNYFIKFPVIHHHFCRDSFCRYFIFYLIWLFSKLIQLLCKKKNHWLCSDSHLCLIRWPLTPRWEEVKTVRFSSTYNVTLCCLLSCTKHYHESQRRFLLYASYAGAYGHSWHQNKPYLLVQKKNKIRN